MKFEVKCLGCLKWGKFVGDGLCQECCEALDVGRLVMGMPEGGELRRLTRGMGWKFWQDKE